MKQLYYFFFLFSIVLISCKSSIKNNIQNVRFVYPEAGTMVKLGESIQVKLSFAGLLTDSVQYFIDETKITSSADTASAISVNTKTLKLGSRLITAKIFSKGKSEQVATNIVVGSSKTPANYTFKIIKTYVHDTASYTEGLEYHNGFLYESDGEYGASSLRKTTIEGKVLQKIDLPAKYFGEGIAVIGNKIIQLTYKEGLGLVYDKQTFKQLSTFAYNHTVEGWGLAYNNTTIYNTDGSNKIYTLNNTNYQSTGYIEVYDDKGPVTQLNELEWVNGKLYANIYTSDLVAIINPQTGEVEAYINLITLPKGTIEDQNNDVLNGIAYDTDGNRLFVTGKKWPKLFQISVLKN
ncbi:MAG: glutaminyl-peptide cyclotransferase [Sphingobacteriales bacterium]|nr:MAG: glutaminyl-peptide cyclotransferase [Sphingobacteriales bacterium]TAF81704.1 MAG: glutaminyl-peptide cyclotransferase [Sphingobacteriales bacterium]